MNFILATWVLVFVGETKDYNEKMKIEVVESFQNERQCLEYLACKDNVTNSCYSKGLELNLKASKQLDSGLRNVYACWSVDFD